MHVAPPDCRDTPTYWFAILEMARKRGDAETATQAERELARLPVLARGFVPVGDAITIMQTKDDQRNGTRSSK